MTARPDIAERLDLQRHPEGGWYRETWRSPVSFAPPGYPGERAAATAIYFLLNPGEESRWHVVRSDEIWLWHSGGPLAIRLGGDAAEPGAVAELVLGSEIAAGQHPQIAIPGGVWQAAAPAGAEAVLVSCVVSPGFDFADLRMFEEPSSSQDPRSP
jgi:hypothetical protein